MRISTRLLLLVLGCLIPMVAAQVYTQVRLHEQRQDRLSSLVLRQAELAHGDMSSIVNGVKQLATVVASFPEMQSMGSACNDRLADLQRNLPPYRFLSIANAAGQLICASSPALLTQPVSTPTWAAALLADPARDVGEFATTTAFGTEEPFLPIAAPLPHGGGTMIAALDLRWLSRHLQELKLEHTPLLGNTTLVLADRRGTVIARFPEGEQWMGHTLPDRLKLLAGQPHSSVSAITDVEGRGLLAAVTSDSSPPTGLTTIETLSLADLMASSQSAVWRDTTLAVGAAMLALVMAWLVGRRFVFRPTEALVLAAKRWGNGDLHARADPRTTDGEFAILAQAFNAMAANLQSREQEMRLQAGLLEVQAAERSRELSETNNRLQVEIAEREKIEAALHQAQKLQAVGQLAGGIAHDFNNMLATILGSLELMERRVAQSAQRWNEVDAERLRTLITRATGAVQRGAQLTSGLLAFSRRPRMSTRATDVNHLIIELVTLATSTLGRRVHLLTDLEEVPWPAMVDPSQVEAAILNLCLNARDAMPEGGTLTIRTRNTELVAPTSADDPPLGPYVCVTISDNGIGMSPEVQQRAFEPFFTTKGGAGSGLGLSQVQSMVRQAGGAVKLRSTPGEGTEATLLLPRATTDATVDQGPRAVDASRRVAAMLVMVVDDDTAVRQVTVEMLRDLGCEVLQAQSAAEALSMLAEAADAPQLVLLDYAMPGMNGLHLARRLRERGMTTPIAMVTGYADLADTEAGQSPLDGLLRKPFTINELQALITRLRDRTHPSSNVVRLQVPQRG
jgi:signal transduction histidine kinase/ActR/RegA family two-component response regulator